MAKPGRAGWARLGAVALALGLAVGVGWLGFRVGGGWGAGLGPVAGFTPLMVERASRRQESGEAVRRVIEPEHGPASLLDPALRVVPFVGREEELAALEDWCTDGDIGLVRLVTGGGGSGKTRLALELMRRMSGQGWECVRVAEDSEREVVVVAARAAAARAGLLLVVDYAEARTGLGGLLEAAARDEGRVRVLLLARQAGDWWERLQGGGASVRGLVRDAAEAVIELGGGLGRGMSAVEEARRAVPFFAARLGVATPDVDLTGLAADSGMEVLDLHATALVAVLSAQGAGGRTDVDAALGLVELLGHEMHYLRGRAQAAGLLDGPHGLSMAQLSQVAAAGCLLGVSSAAELGRRVPGVPASEAVARWLRELYPPGPGGELGVMRPDRLAELHVSRELVGSPGLARACLTGLDQEQARRALVLLARASAEHAGVRALFESSLARFADMVDGVTAPREVMIATAIEEAVTTYRVRAETYPDVFLPGLAMALNDQSSLLARLGRPKEALTAIEEAVTTYRTLAAARPHRYLPDLAMARNEQSSLLARLGRPNEALTAIEKALTSYRALAETRPDVFLPDLAMARNEQSSLLARLGRPNEALTAIEEAVTIRRALAEAHPDAFLPSLAAALDNQSNLLAELGWLEDALTAIEEVITTYRALADDRPDDVFARRYAHSLEIRDAILSALAREADADGAPE